MIAFPTPKGAEVLTEVWDFGELPELAPRWTPGNGTRTPLVYLDTWCWATIARDRAGRIQGEPEEGIYHFLRERTLSGSIVLLLSQAQYQETWPRTNVDARWDAAAVMGELTGFNVMSPKHLDNWEAEQAVVSYFGLDVDVPEPDVFGWGHYYCVHGIERVATIIDTVTGGRLEWEWLPGPDRPRFRLEPVEREVALRVEFAALGLRDPTIEALGVPFPAFVPGVVGGSFHAEQVRIRDAINRYGRTDDVVTSSIVLPALADSLPHLLRAAVRLGQPSERIVEDLATLDPPARLHAMQDLLMAMPVQGPFTELRRRAHLIESFGWEPSDCMDFFGLSLSAPFVDFAVVDRRTFALATTRGTEPWGPLVVLRRLADLRQALESAV
jgi:hypothetical protein